MTFHCKKLKTTMPINRCISNQRKAIAFFGEKAERCGSCPCEQGKTIKEDVDMANKKGICSNCGRGPLELANAEKMCHSCHVASKGLTGDARIEALIDAKIRLNDPANGRVVHHASKQTGAEGRHNETAAPKAPAAVKKTPALIPSYDQDTIDKIAEELNRVPLTGGLLMAKYRAKNIITEWQQLKANGSEHYKTGDVEPLDLYRSGGMFKDFALCNIIKYAFRQRNGLNVSDLDKIIDYSQKLKATIV